MNSIKNTEILTIIKFTQNRSNMGKGNYFEHHDIIIELPEVKKRNGISIYIGIDAEYAGFSITFKKRVKSIILGFVVIRFINVSEAQYNRIITLATLNEAPGLTNITVQKKV